MDIQEKLKLKLQFFAEESNEGNEEIEDNNDDESKDKQDEKVYSEEEFNKRVNDEMNRRLKQKEKEKQEAVDEAKRLAKMNKDQIAEYELEKIRKENEELRAEKQMNAMRSEARSMFDDKNIKASDELLGFVVKEDAESTKKNVESFVDLLDGMVKAQVKEALRQDSPKTFKSTGLSKEDILSIKDDSQRQMAIAQNRQLFN